MHADGCARPEPERLLWLNKVGEPPEHPDHNIGYSQDVVEICPACHGATLERLRHDCFDFEAVYDQYEWYELAPEDGARLQVLASRCDRPLDPFCGCAIHKSLRQSALALPSSSWDAVFEGEAHRHIVTLTGDRAPTFGLVGPYAPAARQTATPAAPSSFDAPTLVFVLVAWPALLGASLAGYFRAVDWPLVVDVLVVVVDVPASFVVAGIVVAALQAALTGTKPASRQSIASRPPDGPGPPRPR